MKKRTHTPGLFDLVKIGDEIAVLGYRPVRGCDQPSSIEKRRVIRVSTKFFVLDDETKVNFDGTSRSPRTHPYLYDIAYWSAEHDEMTKDILRRADLSDTFNRVHAAIFKLTSGQQPIPEGFTETLARAADLLP